MWNNSMNCVSYCLTTLAGTSVGQFLIRFVDRCLWITEKSSQWSLPYHDLIPEVNGKSFKSTKLIRPLPWLLFLPVLMLLRSFRGIWNTGSSIFGYSKLEPSDIVMNVQKARRRLRSIKISGIKSLRQKRTVNHRPMEEGFHVAKRSLLKSIQLTLSSLSCLDSSRSNPSPPPTRIKISVNEVSLTPDEKSATESTIALKAADSKRKFIELNSDEYESDEFEDEPLQDRIDRLAGENSFDDEDFDPEAYNSEDITQSEKDGDESSLDQEIHTLLNDSNIIPESGMTLKWKHDDEPQNISTCGDSNGKNREIVESIEEQRDYHSPQEYKSGDDAEVEFYSPISSKSTTPERVVTNFNEAQSEREPSGDKLMENNAVITDDENLEKNNGHAESSVEKNNKSQNISKNQQKPHQFKGKRVNHGNRKKK